MPYYPEEVINEVRERNDIVDVIGSRIRLEKRGSNYFAKCPFHNDDSPSFCVSQARQTYHCFGCQKSGNVFTFLMEYDNISFPEAVRVLADRAGVQLPEKELSAEEKKRQQKRAVLLQIQKEAAIYYYHQLMSPIGKPGLDYLRGRKLTDKTIKSFGLGFASARSDSLYRYLRKKGFSDRQLLDSGLVRIGEHGAYDNFRSRVMFPIMDIRSRVIGFGGRVMGDGEPKYLNSPETEIFDKGRNMYGLNVARHAGKPYFLVCEGYMDVISLHQAGFTNAVASLGTAFTDKHAQILKKYTDELVLTFDSDGAGIRAALRAAPMVRAAGLKARVLMMTPYKDPDEFIKNMGADAYQERIDSAQNSFMFEIAQLRKDKDVSDPAQRTDFINGSAQKLSTFRDPLERDSYVKAVAQEYAIDYRMLSDKVQAIAEEQKSAESEQGYPGGQYGGGRSTDSGYSRAQEPGYRDSASGGGGYRSGRYRSGGYNSGRYGENGRPGDWQDRRRPGTYSQEGRWEEDSRNRIILPPKKKKKDGIPDYQKTILSVLAQKPSIWKEVSSVLSPDEFQEGVCRQAAEQLFAQLQEGRADSAAIVNSFAAEGGDYNLAASVFEYMPKDESDEKNLRDALRECILRLKKDGYEKRQKEAKDFADLQKIINEEKEFERKWNSQNG
ncbi:MAG: DNA primase [Lachnospiraceae bacterium]|jgi:DNA primase